MAYPGPAWASYTSEVDPTPIFVGRERSGSFQQLRCVDPRLQVVVCRRFGRRKAVLFSTVFVEADREDWQ